MKILDLYNLQEGLTDLSQKEMNVSVAFKVQKNHKLVTDELKSANEVRQKLIDKYKESDDGQGNVKLKKDKVQDFNKESNELLEQKVDIELKHINTDELEGISIKPRTLALLETVLQDGE